MAAEVVDHESPIRAQMTLNVDKRRQMNNHVLDSISERPSNVEDMGGPGGSVGAGSQKQSESVSKGKRGTISSEATSKLSSLPGKATTHGRGELSVQSFNGKDETRDIQANLVPSLEVAPLDVAIAPLVMKVPINKLVDEP